MDPATTTTPAAPAETAAEGDEAAPVAPPRAPSLNDMKAARRAKAVAAPKAPAAPVAASGASTSSSSTSAAPATNGTPAPNAAEPASATATIEMDPAALKQFSTLSRELRDSRAKTKELEGKIAGFGKFEKAQALAKEGKHYDAAREAGIDVDAALAELLGQNGGTATSTQIDKKLADRLEALEKRDADRVKADQDRAAAETDAAVKRDRDVTGKFVEQNAAKYPHLAKAPELVDSVFSDYTKAKAKLEADGTKMSDADQVTLMLESLAVHEEKWAKAFGPAATTEETPTNGVDGTARAGVRQPADKPKHKLTFDELKAERMARRSRPS